MSPFAVHICCCHTILSISTHNMSNHRLLRNSGNLKCFVDAHCTRSAAVYFSFFKPAPGSLLLTLLSLSKCGKQVVKRKSKSLVTQNAAHHK